MFRSSVKRQFTQLFGFGVNLIIVKFEGLSELFLTERYEIVRGSGRIFSGNCLFENHVLFGDTILLQHPNHSNQVHYSVKFLLPFFLGQILFYSVVFYDELPTLLTKHIVLVPNELGQLNIIVSSAVQVVFLMSFNYAIKDLIQNALFFSNPFLILFHDLRNRNVVVFGF